MNYPFMNESGKSLPVKTWLVSDLAFRLSLAYSVLNTDENSKDFGYCRSGYVIIDDKGVVKHYEIICEGRIMFNTDEIIRLLQAFQFSEKYSVVCQSSWVPGKKGINPTHKDPRLPRYWTEELLKIPYEES